MVSLSTKFQRNLMKTVWIVIQKRSMDGQTLEGISKYSTTIMWPGIKTQYCHGTLHLGRGGGVGGMGKRGSGRHKQNKNNYFNVSKLKQLT